MVPGLASTCPRSTSSLSIPRSSAPILSPACPSSSSFRNISTPVTTLLRVAWIPTISTSSHLHDPPLDPPGHHRPPPRDREDVLDRHQKRLVHRPRRRRYIAVHRLHQLPDRLRRLRVLRLLVGLQRRPPDHRHLVPRKLVLLEKLTDLEFDQVEDFRIVDHIDFVHEHSRYGR